MNHQPKILVTPLNWGLGHATRCSMIIDALIAKGWEVGVATSGIALVWLKKRYPDLPMHELPDYGITYQRKGSFMLKLLTMAPAIFKKIEREHGRVQELVRKYHYTGIISDNRFGTHHPDVPTAFITHQLHVMVPFGKGLVHWMNSRFIRRFDQCWIPDFAEPSKRLAGELSAPLFPMKNYHFIGPLTTFKGLKPTPFRYKFLALLSGPEPQRSILEEKLFSQLQATGEKCLLVRGTNKSGGLPSTSKIEVIDLLSAEEVEQSVNQSEIVICRSGYSTIMDLCLMGKKAILVPTPGQTEQEYIAKRLHKLGHAPAMNQKRLDLSEALKMLELNKGLPKLGPYHPPFDEIFKLFEA